MTSGEFFKQLLNRNGVMHAKGLVPVADGRPLFAYRCSEHEYQTLCGMAKSGPIKDLLDGKYDGSYAKALLCLFAAERLRRHHGEGVFKWEDALGVDPKDKTKVYEAISEGMKNGWQRKHSIQTAVRSDRRQYIYSLACEGGLPLKLLLNPKVRDYFKSLQRIRATQKTPLQPETAKDEAHGRLLTKIWHESYVYPLICDLINGISDLQTYLSGDNDPIAQLDQRAPNWRDNLPINADDHQLSDLLSGLVTEMHRLTTSRTQRNGSHGRVQPPATECDIVASLKVKTLLTEKNGQWHLSRKVALNDRISDLQVRNWLASDTDARRLHILAEIDDEANSLSFNWALLRRFSSDWKREWKTTAGDEIPNSSLYSRVRLILTDERRIKLPSLFGNIPEQRPLLFTADKAGWQYRGVCQAHSTIADAEAVLALPSNWVLMQAKTESQLGTFDGLSLICVSGEVLLMEEQTEEKRRLNCGTDDRGIADFQLRGEHVHEDLSPTQAFRGLPRLAATDFEGRPVQLPDTLQWRPVSAKDWQTEFGLAFGRLALGCGTAFRDTVNVMPPGFGILSQIANGTELGHYRFTNAHGAKIECDCAGVSVESDCVICPARADAAPIDVRFSWLNPARTVTLRLAYPQRSAQFWLGEHRVTEADLVPHSRLTGLSVRAMDQVDNRPLYLYCDGEPAADCDGQAIKLEFRKGRINKHISSESQRAIADQLAESTSESLLLELRQNGKCVAKCRIAHFAYELGYDDKRRLLQIQKGRMHSALTVKLMRIDQSECVELNTEADEAWRVSEQSGVWCALAYEGNWACSKPQFINILPRKLGTMAALLANVPESKPVQPTSFEAALLGQGIDALIQRLAENPQAPDWQTFWSLLNLAKLVGSAWFSPLKEFLTSEQFLCMALFQATVDQRHDLLELIKTLPICIEALPISRLNNSFARWILSLQQIGFSYALIKTLQKELTETSDSYWRCVGGLVAEKKLIATQLLPFAQNELKDRASELQGRLAEAIEWPKTPELERKIPEIDMWVRSCCPNQWQQLTAPQRSGRLAPFVIAHTAFNGIPTTLAMRREVRKLKAFDNEWFQAAYAIALTLYFAQGVNHD